MLIVVSCLSSILCRQPAERCPHLSSFPGALIFDWARTRRHPHIKKKPPFLNCCVLFYFSFSCRVGALIFPWRPAIVRVLRERRPHLCCRVMMAADMVLCWPHTLRRQQHLFYACAQEGLFLGPFLFTSASCAGRQKSGCPCAGGRVAETIVLC